MESNLLPGHCPNCWHEFIDNYQGGLWATILPFEVPGLGCLEFVEAVGWLTVESDGTPYFVFEGDLPFDHVLVPLSYLTDVACYECEQPISEFHVPKKPAEPLDTLIALGKTPKEVTSA